MLAFIAGGADYVFVLIGIKTKLDNADRASVRHADTPRKKAFLKKRRRILSGGVFFNQERRRWQHPSASISNVFRPVPVKAKEIFNSVLSCSNSLCAAVNHP